ncbi:MAG: hypothetical protein ABEJ59_05935 [Halanaeroarchaeum sp.]
MASPFVATLPAEQPTYEHAIERVDRSAIPDRADVMHYANLSPEARAAIDDALHGDGVIRGRADRLSEFFYSDHASLGRGLYFVERDGSYYRLTTFAGGGFFLAGLLVNGALFALGLAVGAVGALSFRTDRRRLPTVFGAFGVHVLGASFVAPVANWRAGLVGAAGAGTLAGVAAVGAIARRRPMVVAVAIGVALAAGLAVLGRLGPVSGVPRVFVSPMFVYGLAIVIGALGGGYLLGAGYERWRRG